MKAALSLLAIISQLWLGIAHAFMGSTSTVHEGVFCGDLDPASIRTLLAKLPPELRELATQDEDCCSNSCELCAPLFSPALTPANTDPTQTPALAQHSPAHVRSRHYQRLAHFRPPATGPPSIPQ